MLKALREAASGPIQRRTILEIERDGESGKEVLRFIVRPARHEDSAIAMLIVEDITQQRVAAEARKSFLAQAAHELRTPLANVRLNAEMALNEMKGNPKGQARCLSLINSEAIRLERMVEDVLSVAEVESGSLRMNRDDVRTDELLREVHSAYEAQAKEKQIALSFDLAPKLPVLQGDRSKIAQAVHNLVGNALKYTPKQGKVHVAASIADGQFVLEVTDSGIGIAEKDWERVFERFYRAKSRSVSQTKGSGLGLTIAREIVRLHGGDITVTSKPRKGSTFTLRLPAGEESP